jgi:hypothetical protein
MTLHRLSRCAALGLALAALVAPTAAAQQDLRSPDTRDAALAGEQADSQSLPAQDLRSPDARDAAAGRGSFNSPEVTVVKLERPSPSSDAGLDWGDAGIGACVLLGLLLLALGGTLAVMHRRQSLRRHAATMG